MPPQTDNYRVTIKSLNIREMPTTTSKVLGRLSESEVVEELGESDDGK